LIAFVLAAALVAGDPGYRDPWAAAGLAALAPLVCTATTWLAPTEPTRVGAGMAGLYVLPLTVGVGEGYAGGTWRGLGYGALGFGFVATSMVVANQLTIEPGCPDPIAGCAAGGPNRADWLLFSALVAAGALGTGWDAYQAAERHNREALGSH
jgi:hypothetical protein